MTKTMKISVSMDGLRKNLARDYIQLVDFLNYTFKNGWEIDKTELQDKLLALRQDIGILHCVFDPNTEQFSDLSEETSKMDIILFAPENNQ